MLFYSKGTSQALYIVMKSQRQIKAAEAVIVKALKDKLGINNLFREFDIVVNMTRNLQIKWKAFARLEPIRHLPREDVIKIIKSVPFLTFVKGRNGKIEDDCVRIAYQNSQKLLLVTGIAREAIDQMLREFSSRGCALFPHLKQTMTAKVIANNGFWITIQTNAEDTAFYLKKFLRNRKRANDQLNFAYKIEGKRIRIVILQEDFFSILVDAMTELKCDAFRQTFVQSPFPNERRKSQDQSQLLNEPKRFGIIYRSVALNYYGKPDVKEEELSDGFSESNSLNSDILDASKLKDLIETSDQGIQSESNAEYELSLDNTSEREEKEEKDSRSHSSVNDSPQSRTQTQPEQQLQAVEKSQILREQIQELVIDTNSNYNSSVSPKKQPRDEAFSRKPCSTTDLGSDNPFVSTIQEATPVTAPQAAIQTQEPLYSSISYPLMKRLLVEYKQVKSSQMLELPSWMQSESQEERSRHKFFGSLCRPKIIQRRCSPFQ